MTDRGSPEWKQYLTAALAAGRTVAQAAEIADEAYLQARQPSPSGGPGIEVSRIESGAQRGVRTTDVVRPLSRKVKRNRAQCRKCLETIESLSRHNLVYCKCQTIFVDGGRDYVRVGGHEDDVLVLTEYEEDDIPF